MKGLQNLLNVCSDFSKHFDVIFNVIKSKCIIFNICKQKFTNPPFFLSEKPLEMVKTIKYLGITISNDLPDDEEMNYMVRNLYCKCNQIIRKFNKYSASVKK